MGIRETQVFGLSGAAWDFLGKNAITEEEVCPTCGHVTGDMTRPLSVVYDKETGVHAGMFDDGPYLHKYTLKTGGVLKEVIQCVPWSSGPCIFLCLEDEKGEKMFEWDRESVENC